MSKLTPPSINDMYHANIKSEKLYEMTSSNPNGFVQNMPMINVENVNFYGALDATPIPLPSSDPHHHSHHFHHRHHHHHHHGQSLPKNKHHNCYTKQKANNLTSLSADFSVVIFFLNALPSKTRLG